MTTPNDKQLQKDMDEQQEIHERLMVPPVERVWIGRCTSPSAWYKDRIGDIVSVFAKDSYGYWTRDTGPMRLSQWIREEDAVPVGAGLDVSRPIPAPQKQDLPQVDTKTLLRDITALKAKVRDRGGR